MQRVSQEILQAVIAGRIQSKDDLQRMKRKLCRQYKVQRFPSDVEILGYATDEEKQKVTAILRKKPTRSLSGVVIVAVMTKPMECPGQCIYCPTNLPTAPKAYVGEEPAALRAQQNRYDPYLQVRSRLNQLQSMGHNIEKVELIVMGGTFPSAPTEYQNAFIKSCFDAMIGHDTQTITEAIKLAETSTIRPIGLTIETRPDYCRTEHVDTMLAFGTTRVELGVQTIYDDIYSKVCRGHKISAVIAATQILKDAGLKVCYHIMPGLPGSTPDRDKQIFKELFARSKFRPDMLKIYPCLVLRGSALFEMWRKGEYTPYSTEEVVELLADIVPYLPPWVRIQRMQRDIPKRLIIAGPDAGNLTQLVFQQAEEKGHRPQTIRRREVGYNQRASQKTIHDPLNVENLVCQVTEYSASQGTELFITYDDVEADTLIGYLRLRIPSTDTHRPEIQPYDAALLRELHVYGLSVNLGEIRDNAWQHRGVGSKLLSTAEEIALEKGRDRIVCTSGIGARQYYRRFGYHYDGPYMTKNL